jgi:hypothetical protein
MRRARVDLDAGTVDIAGSVAELSGKLTIGPVETRVSRRKVSLPGGVVEELAVPLLAPWRPTDHVVKAPGGGPLRIGLVRSRVWYRRPPSLG